MDTKGTKMAANGTTNGFDFTGGTASFAVAMFTTLTTTKGTKTADIGTAYGFDFTGTTTTGGTAFFAFALCTTHTATKGTKTAANGTTNGFDFTGGTASFAVAMTVSTATCGTSTFVNMAAVSGINEVQQTTKSTSAFATT